MKKKVSSKVQVKNMMGLHTRPASAIVKMLQKTKSNVSFSYNKMTINAKSILSILLLAAKKNSKIIVTVEGEDAEEVLGKLMQGFETGFGE